MTRKTNLTAIEATILSCSFDLNYAVVQRNAGREPYVCALFTDKDDAIAYAEKCTRELRAEMPGSQFTYRVQTNMVEDALAIPET